MSILSSFCVICKIVALYDMSILSSFCVICKIVALYDMSIILYDIGD